MRFSNLQERLRNSSSSRQYLLSLPTAVQLQLHTQNSWIHTQYELRRNAHAILKFQKIERGNSAFF